MPVSLEEYDLPSMVGWLIGLHGHGTVRGILGGLLRRTAGGAVAFGRGGYGGEGSFVATD